MRAFEIIFEAEIPETPYGYWIDPQGNYHVVPLQSHSLVIATMGLDEEEALDQGWIRVISNSKIFVRKNLIVDFLLGRPGRRAIGAACRLVTSRDWDGYEAEIGAIPSVNDTGFDYWKRFETQSAFLSYLRRAAHYKPEMVEQYLLEAELPQTDYGYWIAPDGTVHPVAFQMHYSTIRGLIGKGNWEAMDDGWVRVVVDHGQSQTTKNLEVEIFAHKPSSLAAGSLRRIARSAEFGSINISIHKSDPRSNLGYGKSFTEVDEFMRFFARARQPVEEGNLTEAEVPTTDYGYWVDPDGGIHSVKHSGHGEWLAERNLNGYESVFKKGWIRVVTNGLDDVPTLCGHFMRGAVSPRALSGLSRVASSGEWHNYRLDIVSTSFKELDSKCFNRPGHFMAAAREADQPTSDDVSGE
jgi:hypothetical protein